MSLPDVIEIIPLERPVFAEITVPGSKSITNRALVLAALGVGESELRGALWSEDTQVMVECLRRLGFAVEVEADPVENCNRTIRVVGMGGRIPRGGSEGEPLELFVGNAGTAARFLAALVCLGNGFYRLHGVPRMHERPQGSLFEALRELGYRVDASNDRLPAVIEGAGAMPGAQCRVSIVESSQFASGRLLGARVGGWKIGVFGENAEESPYVAMTAELIKAFPARGGCFQIEPDASSGSYFWAAGRLMSVGDRRDPVSDRPTAPDVRSGIREGIGGRVTVRNWPRSGWQMDSRFPEYLTLPGELSRERDLGDSILTAMILAAVPGVAAAGLTGVRFTDLGRLRVQECERVKATKAELSRCGVAVIEAGDTLEVFPAADAHGAEVETYEDHRMAMAFAILGLKVPGTKIKNPACVKKTFPNFFQKLAAVPPAGLGATLRHGATGTELEGKDLFAD
jgi:3-phosphoshikimate 1-carboxyvinyltransferase